MAARSAQTLLHLEDDDAVTDPWAALDIEKTPQTLSFINDVQSAVAQIEQRLATPSSQSHLASTTQPSSSPTEAPSLPEDSLPLSTQRHDPVELSFQAKLRQFEATPAPLSASPRHTSPEHSAPPEARAHSSSPVSPLPDGQRASPLPVASTVAIFESPAHAVSADDGAVRLANASVVPTGAQLESPHVRDELTAQQDVASASPVKEIMKRFEADAAMSSELPPATNLRLPVALADADSDDVVSPRESTAPENARIVSEAVVSKPREPVVHSLAYLIDSDEGPAQLETENAKESVEELAENETDTVEEVAPPKVENAKDGPDMNIEAGEEFVEKSVQPDAKNASELQETDTDTIEEYVQLDTGNMLDATDVHTAVTEISDDSTSPSLELSSNAHTHDVHGLEGTDEAKHSAVSVPIEVMTSEHEESPAVPCAVEITPVRDVAIAETGYHTDPTDTLESMTAMTTISSRNDVAKTFANATIIELSTDTTVSAPPNCSHGTPPMDVENTPKDQGGVSSPLIVPAIVENIDIPTSPETQQPLQSEKSTSPEVGHAEFMDNLSTTIMPQMETEEITVSPVARRIERSVKPASSVARKAERGQMPGSAVVHRLERGTKTASAVARSMDPVTRASSFITPKARHLPGPVKPTEELMKLDIPGSPVTPAPKPNALGGGQARGTPSSSMSRIRRSLPREKTEARLPRVAGLNTTDLPEKGRPGRPPRRSTFSLPRAKTSLSAPAPMRRPPVTPVTPVTPHSQSINERNGASSPGEISLKKTPLRRTLTFSSNRRSTGASTGSPITTPRGSPEDSNSPASSSSSSSRPFSVSNIKEQSDVQDDRGVPAPKRVDRRATLSTTHENRLRPPRNPARGNVTVPRPFSLGGLGMHEKAQQQIQEARRKADEDERRRPVFKARPMPDFSKPYPKPH